MLESFEVNFESDMFCGFSLGRVGLGHWQSLELYFRPCPLVGLAGALGGTFSPPIPWRPLPFSVVRC